MSGANPRLTAIQQELRLARAELQQAEEMIRFAESDFLIGQSLLVESLQWKVGALIRSAKKEETAI